MNQDIWYTGVDDYIKHVYTQDPKNKMNKFDVVLQDKPHDPTLNVYEAFNKIFINKVPKKIELLFSGGLDSDFILDLCLENKLPVECITMELHLDGLIINTHDLYYSEKICRAKNVKRKVVSLNAKTFHENGDYQKYLRPYRITVPHVSTHFWLIEQCDTFPMLAGDYHWGWDPNYKKVISPQRHAYSHYNRFMKSIGLDGSGNIMNHSQEINLLCIKEHVSILKNINSDLNSIHLKRKVYEKLSGKSYEPRLRNYGWDNLSPSIFDRVYYRNKLLEEFGDNDLSISWGHNVANVIGGVPGTWNKFF